MSIRVRYAPSPTGHLHIGNARTALFNYLFARKHQGSFIIRIEDTDLARNIDTGIENQLNYLKWLGIDWDESIDKPGKYGPYRQLERLKLYQDNANSLLKSGHAYRCYCTAEELALERDEQVARGDDQFHYSRKCLNAPLQDKPYTIRFKVPSGVNYKFKDIVKGDVSFSSEAMGDWVIIKQNGIPTYNYACVIDDYLMNITHVLRGEDHLTNTPKQLMIFDAFNWPYPIYGHMTLIVNEQGKKLSKRDESIIQFIEQYLDMGYLPEALFNFIALLGWSPDATGEIFDKEALIHHFDEKRLSTSPARFDTTKLTYINNRYIKQLSLEDTKKLCLPFLTEANIGFDKDEAWFDSLVSVFKDRLSYGKEIVTLYHDFFDPSLTLDEESINIIKEPNAINLLEIFAELLISSDNPTVSDYQQMIKESGQRANVKGKSLFMPIRIAISGSMHGPDLPQMMHLMGKDLLINRLKNSMKTFN